VHFRGVLGKLGGWGMLRGCSDGSPSVLCCSRAVVRDPERGRASGTTVVDAHVVNDVAELVDAWGIVVGSWWMMGARGTSWVGLEGVGRVLDRR
jgi:hypothetical protein